jgi:hypothetical protein
VTSQGGQYPDGPLEPPPGWFGAEALRKRASAVPAVEEQAWQALGQVMHNLLNPEPSPGPPYVHTLVLPAPCPTDCDPDCELNPDERHEIRQARDHDPDECEASRKPGPACALTES